MKHQCNQQEYLRKYKNHQKDSIKILMNFDYFNYK